MEPEATTATAAHRKGLAVGSVHGPRTGVLQGPATAWDITEVAGEERRKRKGEKSRGECRSKEREGEERRRGERGEERRGEGRREGRKGEKKREPEQQQVFTTFSFTHPTFCLLELGIETLPPSCNDHNIKTKQNNRF